MKRSERLARLRRRIDEEFADDDGASREKIVQAVVAGWARERRERAEMGKTFRRIVANERAHGASWDHITDDLIGYIVNFAQLARVNGRALTVSLDLLEKTRSDHGRSVPRAAATAKKLRYMERHSAQLSRTIEILTRDHATCSEIAQVLGVSLRTAKKLRKEALSREEPALLAG